MPKWWGADASHWSSRTTALLSFAALLVGTTVGIVGIVGRDNPQPERIDPGQALQTSPPVADGGSMCSSDSEGSVLDGWGPDRATYHDTTFPDHLTFNSTSENVNIGDERNFVAVKPTTIAKAGQWADSLEVHNGQEYLIRIYARLDGPENLTAKATNLSVNLPTCTGHRVGVSAILGSDDAFPREIWDGASFWSRNDFNLALIPDSGKIESNAHPDTGLAYSTNDLVTSKGINLGSKRLDGVFAPGYANAVYVTFRVRAQVAD